MALRWLLGECLVLPSLVIRGSRENLLAQCPTRNGTPTWRTISTLFCFLCQTHSPDSNIKQACPKPRSSLS